jgi:hypothetical protein
MAELVSKAIQVTVQKDCKGPFQGFREGSKMSLKIICVKFTAIHANEDKFLQFLFLNTKILENETPEQVEMEEEVHIECFKFLNFFLGRDLVEMDGRNIFVHFALRILVSWMMQSMLSEWAIPSNR